MSTLSSCTQISNSPINTSKSKMLWSFSKSPRFFGKPQYYTSQIYNMPSARMTRTTNFGYGKRSQFATRSAQNSPSPTAYEIKSGFILGKEKRTGFSFGIAREAYEKVYCKAQPYIDKALPGPGTYSPPSTVGSGGNRYTMRNKTAIPKDTTWNVPGPGSYEKLESINPTGKQFLTSFKSSGCTTFNPPSSGRFAQLKTAYAPGPGAYSLPGIATDGIYNVSNFKNSYSRTFAKQPRQTLALSGTVAHTPGPGSYRAPSEFGYYESPRTPGSVVGRYRSNLSAGTHRISKSVSQPEFANAKENQPE